MLRKQVLRDFGKGLFSDVIHRRLILFASSLKKKEETTL
jgi:hypothetical protein